MKQTSLRIKFGKQVRHLRRAKKLSQEALGFKANIHRTYIGAIERGEQNVSIDNIQKLAKALRIDVKEFFDF